MTTTQLPIATFADVSEATSTADMIATYNMLTGKSIQKFSSRAAGMRQLENAFMAATDRAAHKGVPRGAKPNPADGCLPAGGEDAPAGESSDADEDKAGAGCFQQLADKAVAPKAPPSAPARKRREPRAAVPGARPRMAAVKANTDKPTNFQEGSIRSKVYDTVKAAPRHTIGVKELDAVVGFNSRPYLQKLAEMGYVTVIPERREDDPPSEG